LVGMVGSKIWVVPFFPAFLLDVISALNVTSGQRLLDVFYGGPRAVS
jgi:hypothetical protein